MPLRVSKVFIALLLALAGCAKGELEASNGLTSFGPGSAASQTMSASDPSDPSDPGDEGNTDTESGTDATVSDGTTGTAASTDPSTDTASEVGGEDCGNGAIDGLEQCDGSELGGNDCVSAGFAGGMLACSDQCIFDTAACVNAVCGDGLLQGGEACDCGMTGSPCTADQLGNTVCTALKAPTGGNYSGGPLVCTPECSFDQSGCTACGDGEIDAGEACDGAALGGQSCATQGFDTGALGCGAACTFNTAGCANYVCGNGACEPGEDSCSCAPDCPDDPNTCSVCQCGGFGGNCYCDNFCLQANDCCVDGPC